MSIKDFYAQSEVDFVHLTNNRQLKFSLSIIKRFKLNNFRYVRVGVDSELRRIYFSFQSEATPGICTLSSTKRGNQFKISFQKLCSQYEWVDNISKERDEAKRKFIFEEVDQTKNEIFPKYKFFVTVGYSWSGNRDFNDIKQYPIEPGVYRLKKDSEILRIGEGNNIADRLKKHLKEFGTKVNAFDFEIVPNEDERKKEQTRLLQLFKDSTGKLPKLNLITN